MNARHTGVLATTVAAAVVVALATTALADRTVVPDAKGDGKCSGPAWDIRKAIAGHAPGGRLKHVVRMRRAKSFPVPMILIKVKGSKGVRYEVDASARPPRVIDTRTREVTGKVKKKRGGNRWILLFHRSALGDPARYRWLATTGVGGHAPCDRAPNKGFRPHRLGWRSLP